MTRYALIFNGGANPQTPEEGKEVMAAWTSWLDGLGESLENMGNAFGDLIKIDTDGTTRAVDDVGGLSGYTLIQAETHEQAVELASACPILRYGGSIHVAELVAL